MVAIQAVLIPSQVPVAMAMLVFSQTLGGAVFVTAAQTVFSTTLRQKVVRYSPQVDVNAVIAAGATGITQVVQEADMPGVLQAYSESVGSVFWLAVAAGVIGFVFSWGMGWNDVREKKKPATGDV